MEGPSEEEPEVGVYSRDTTMKLLLSCYKLLHLCYFRAEAARKACSYIAE